MPQTVYRTLLLEMSPFCLHAGLESWSPILYSGTNAVPWESGAIHEEEPSSDSPDWCGVYSIWSKLEQKVCCKPHTSQENLKKALLREWHRFPMESIRTAIENWRPRLQACVKAKGGTFLAAVVSDIQSMAYVYLQ